LSYAVANAYNRLNRNNIAPKAEQRYRQHFKLNPRSTAV
jgi:hypothetical protein